jgi:hypothetical protein
LKYLTNTLSNCGYAANTFPLCLTQFPTVFRIPFSYSSISAPSGAPGSVPWNSTVPGSETVEPEPHNAAPGIHTVPPTNKRPATRQDKQNPRHEAGTNRTNERKKERTNDEYSGSTEQSDLPCWGDPAWQARQHRTPNALHDMFYAHRAANLEYSSVSPTSYLWIFPSPSRYFFDLLPQQRKQ